VSLTGRAARTDGRSAPGRDEARASAPELDEARASAPELDEARAAQLLPHRWRRAHKGTHGRLVCVAGSLDYAGAALLCGLGAARLGTGLVTLAVPADLQPIFAGRVPELTTLGLDADADTALDQIDARSPAAIVVGPGLAEGEAQAALVSRLLVRGGQLVLDGGALNLLARSGEWWSDARATCVLTPHPGEFARLDGRPVGDADDERAARAAAAAARFGQVVVLKGARTVVGAADGRLAVAPFENPALAVAGTGDVLAGAIGGLMAQGLEPFDAACLGVFLHGAAADRLARRLGDSGLLASDLPLEMALVRRDLAARAGAS
jgi:ADP-dependent NAD(P)H-hydrate dehydratase / NAD(P)H-hydrate epimerase